MSDDKDKTKDKDNKDQRVPKERFDEVYGQMKGFEDRAEAAEAKVKKYKDAEASATQKKLEDKGDYEKALKIANDKSEASETELKDVKAAQKISEARNNFIQSKKETIPIEIIEKFVPPTSDEKELETGWKKALDRCKELKIGEKSFSIGSGAHDMKVDTNDKGKPDNRSPNQKIADGVGAGQGFTILKKKE